MVSTKLERFWHTLYRTTCWHSVIFRVYMYISTPKIRIGTVSNEALKRMCRVGMGRGRPGQRGEVERKMNLNGFNSHAVLFYGLMCNSKLPVANLGLCVWAINAEKNQTVLREAVWSGPTPLVILFAFLTHILEHDGYYFKYLRFIEELVPDHIFQQANNVDTTSCW